MRIRFYDTSKFFISFRQVINPVLPQFHPRQLLEWMNLGHLLRVKAILAHLTRCLTAWNRGPIIQPLRQRRTSLSWGSSRFREVRFQVILITSSEWFS